MPRIYSLLVPAVAWAFGLSAHAPTRTAGRVSGAIVDSRGPVRGADVRLVDPELDRALVTTSDSAGAFEFGGVTRGSWTLVVRRIGYQLHTQPVVVRGAESHVVRVTLTAVAQPLDTVSVVEAGLVPARYGPSSRMEEFYRRRARGRGRFFTREDIEESGRSKLTDLLRLVPGARVKTLPGNIAEVAFARCSGSGRLPSGVDPNPRGSVSSGGWSPVAFYYNGVPVDTATGRRMIGELDLGEIEGVEVYRGVAELPLEAMGNTCAAIYVWTRFGPGT
jgi:Carboxypeptidase regulatory-like domain/TonB-dependent Receptor Plug Domain